MMRRFDRSTDQDPTFALLGLISVALQGYRRRGVPFIRDVRFGGDHPSLHVQLTSSTGKDEWFTIAATHVTPLRRAPTTPAGPWFVVRAGEHHGDWQVIRDDGIDELVVFSTRSMHEACEHRDRLTARQDRRAA